MNKKHFISSIYISLFIVLLLSISTGHKAYGINYLQSTVSMRYLQGVKSSIKLDLNEDNTYYVIQPQSNNEKGYSSIFGEDALTEENILRFFIFNKENINLYGRM